MTEQDLGEFAFLADAAADVGRTAGVPAVQRVALTAEISALTWGDGPAGVVLVHGVALNAHTWDAVALAWPDPSVGFLALDLPGHGDSPWRPDADYHPAVLAGPVAAALRAATERGLLSPTPVFVGHSLGGLVGLELLADPAVSLARLVLVDILPLPADAAGMVAAFLDGPSWFNSREEIVQRALAFGLGGGRASLERAVFLNTRLDGDRVVWKHHLGVLGGAGLKVPPADQVWPLIADSPVPIDLVVAAMSILDASVVEHFERLRPQARVVGVAGGHNVQEDAPRELAAALFNVIAAG